MTATLTRTQKIREAKVGMSDESKLATAAITGKKMDREVASDAAMKIVSKLLTGQAAGGNREESVLVLRACLGLEQGVFDSAFAQFKGSLTDVASLGKWAKPFSHATMTLNEREESARKIGLWGEVAVKVEKERKALEKARDAKNAPKLEQKAAAFLNTIRPFIDRAEEKLAQSARRAAQETAPEAVEA